MTREQPPKRRPPYFTAAAFVLAFAASIFTLIYTGLAVNAPRHRTAENPPAAPLDEDEIETVGEAGDGAGGPAVLPAEDPDEAEAEAGEAAVTEPQTRPLLEP